MTTIAFSSTDANYAARLRERCGGRASNAIFALGNLDLLELPKNALFCSACCPGDGILDKAAEVLAQHFGITPEELNFTLNCDLKHRLGRDTETEEA